MKVILKFSDGSAVEVPDASKTNEFVKLIKKREEPIKY
ncbi:hypothetical protein SAMN05216243_2813 [Sediminibacillus albus]|uniref:Uncharacterized protein n=1 Tax=Sediminibacillus albus TaxID=407036 RepID=A0A1G9B6S3_9BACI|nr:hypothetical protein SAMN05216243_2813 [Sediminibacillus albus]